MTTVGSMRFSVLDRAAATPAETEAETLRGVAEHARHVESLGFERFTVAEHHGVDGIPSGQPALMAAHAAAVTQRLRVGTAGIMVPGHPPFLIAEQAATLAALYPGRVDIGLGNSVGFTAPVRAALRQDPKARERYGDDLDELLSYLRGDAGVTARPRLEGDVGLFLLAGYASARAAGRLGLGVILGGPVATQLKAAQTYRANFQPSEFCPAPHVISSLNIAVAETEEKAADLLAPEAYAQAMAQSTGRFSPLVPAADLDLAAMTSQQRARMRDIQAHHVVGTPGAVRRELAAIASQLGVEEFLVTGDIPDRAGRAESERLLAQQ